MAYRYNDAGDLGRHLETAKTEGPDNLFWEQAAERAGVPARDLRIVASEPEHAFLLGETWIIELADGGYSVREWRGVDDSLFESAKQLGAFEDLS